MVSLSLIMTDFLRYSPKFITFDVALLRKLCPYQRLELEADKEAISRFHD